MGMIGYQPQPAVAASDPVIAAAGDIACDPVDSNFNHLNGTATKCHMKYTAQQIANGGYDAALALGDLQYACGGAAAFAQSYDPTWGTIKGITHPAVGNHEYDTSGGTDCGRNAAAYYSYFGSAAGVAGQGYYSFDVGTWHLIALNSNCSFVSCAAGSAQETWLKNDLATHPNTCTLAYWHHPRFSAGPSTDGTVKPFWNDLFAAKADIVLNGHKHNYQRLAKFDPNGTQNANGIREFVVGTGGINRGLSGTPYAGTEAKDGTHFGILELTLHPSSYDWRFIADTGQVIDSGSDQCVGGGGGGGGGNAAPTAENGTSTVLQDSSNNPVELTGHDAETCDLNFSIVSPPAGTLDPLAVQPCTSGSPNTDRATTSYQPPPSFSGTDSFTYRVNDGTTDSSIATVTITVTPTGGGGGGGGVISLRSSSSAANATATTLTIPAPASVQAGDVMLAGISVRGQPTITPPPGWVLARQDVNGTTQKQAIYYKVATGSESGPYTWTFAASRAASGGILDYTGVSAANPIDASGGQVNATASKAITAPSITTTVGGDQLVGFFCVTGNNTFTPPPGTAELFDIASNAVSPYISSEGADELRSAAGPTGGRTATAALQGQGIGQLVALRPA